MIFEDGAPDGILNVINGDKDEVDAILDHPEIMAIGFVGSTPIAQYIYSRGCANGRVPFKEDQRNQPAQAERQSWRSSRRCGVSRKARKARRHRRGIDERRRRQDEHPR